MMIEADYVVTYEYRNKRIKKKPAKQDIGKLTGADAKPAAVIAEEASHD